MLNLARAALTAAALALAPTLALADRVNLLVMGEDAAPDTIARHTPVHDRVLEAISGELRARGFSVFDETAVTLDFYDQARIRRSDAELISLARSVQVAPIDAVTVFEIHAATVPSAYEGIIDLRLRIAGRVVAVQDGLSLGGYEVSYRPGELPALPLDCNRACQIAFVGDHAARIARDVGAALAAQLAAVVKGDAAVAAPAPANICDGTPGTFTLAFRGFDPAELARFETFLTLFQGYAAHGPAVIPGADTALRYETCTDAARLEKNLRAMFQQTGTEVWLETHGAEFTASKIATPTPD